MTDHQPGEVYRVAGSGGVGLHVRAWGPPQAPPILFIHGWSASYLAWHRQFDSPLREHFRLVCMDLRGHGLSDKPLDPTAYQSGAHWADDIAAVIAALRLTRPILVGWSYGGYVVSDYLARHGTENLRAVAFVGAAVIASMPPVHVGAAFMAAVKRATSEDPAMMIEGLRDALDTLTHRPASEPDRARALCAMSLTAPPVRGWMLMRTLDFTDTLLRLDRPCRVIHGREDRVILPAMAEHIAAHVPAARLSWYDACGHTPHQEYAERFNTELAELAS